jgi:hypothetical protein
MSRPNSPTPQHPILAQIVGDDSCAAEGFTATGHAPILALCRKLIEASFDPRRPLHAFRGTMLCLTVRSLREGAALIVKTSGNGAPVFAPLDGAAAPPRALGPEDRGISTPEAVAPAAGATSQHGYRLP